MKLRRNRSLLSLAVDVITRTRIEEPWPLGHPPPKREGAAERAATPLRGQRRRRRR